MTDKELVRAAYPDAYAWWTVQGWVVVEDPNAPRLVEVSRNGCPTEGQAWASAATILRDREVT